MKAFLLRLLGVGKTFWSFLEPFFAAQTRKVLEVALPTALSIVASLSSSKLEGDAKRKQAVDQLRAALFQQGISAASSLLNLAVETAYNKLKVDEGKL